MTHDYGPRRGRWVAVALLATACAACGTGGHPATATDAPSTTSVSAPPTTYGNVLGGVISAASRGSCRQDAQAVEQASQFYAAEHGHPAASIGALVSNGILQTAPRTGHGYVILYDHTTGRVTAAGACTGP